jgi:hypothetical protein
MGLFRKRQERSQVPVSKLIEVAGALGTSFETAVRHGVVPPPGWTFVNRFCRTPPGLWPQSNSALAEATPEQITKSVDAVTELLLHLQTHSGTLAEWLAAEEAVTQNLMAYTQLPAQRASSTGVGPFEEIEDKLRDGVKGAGWLQSGDPNISDHPSQIYSFVVSGPENGAKYMKPDDFQTDEDQRPEEPVSDEE